MAGRYARQALQGIGIWESIATRLILADSVRQVLDYLRRGEIDAGLVYNTDIHIAGKTVRPIAKLSTKEPLLIFAG